MLDKVKKTIIDETNKKWEKEKCPLLLSSLGLILQDNDLLGEKPKNATLYQWIKDLEINDIKFVKDKTIQAKIGILPIKENFDWPIHKYDRLREGNITFLDFTQLLRKKLTDDEISQIPTSILLKIFDY